MVDTAHSAVKALLPLIALAALLVDAPDAHADVFEISSDGEWQQINQQPFNMADLPLDELGIKNEKLPPVRLSVITSISEPSVAPQGMPVSPVVANGQYAPLINAAAGQYGISPALVDAVMWQESRYNHKALSSAGAVGLMQLMPGTARTLGVNPHDPWQNVFGGAAYLRKQLDLFDNNVPFALAAYNAGPGAVIKYGGIPPYAETRNYVKVIMRRLMNQAQ